ncbi:MAG: DoxX family protein [Bacteroidales bacterium]|jgi:putative oxidoreductase|nr:DoxX family protein [Paludibacter sp.]MDD4576542.1 DoxX family protein [Bacteroidales bacterium]
MKRNLNFLIKDWRIGHDTGLLILRLLFGLVLIYGHGFAKMSVIFSGEEIQFMDPIGIGAVTSFYMAAFAEGVCAILLILGLFSRISTLILSINFLVIFIFHAFMLGDGFAVLELRLFYLFSFIALTFTGPGRWSLDYLLFRQENELEKA